VVKNKLQSPKNSTEILRLFQNFGGNQTRRDAAGWYVLPFQGEGLICNPA
jgi:hypothetical protein